MQPKEVLRHLESQGYEYVSGSSQALILQKPPDNGGIKAIIDIIFNKLQVYMRSEGDDPQRNAALAIHNISRIDQIQLQAQLAEAERRVQDAFTILTAGTALHPKSGNEFELEDGESAWIRVKNIDAKIQWADEAAIVDLYASDGRPDLDLDQTGLNSTWAGFGEAEEILEQLTAE